ncbi:gamma-glutamyltransferase [Pseudoblastomonas halimionae]|uniref:Glutathione hydrolase proenzyme n=1 Tax=Alteriqipengyuania halimionae TaxID=1926630 RepID=A0A6I4U945_9SPHN|nr:gamma-glutamyltransferase [Alteriqipengyuania halimionae]MXP10807.1 gamma-glutamyltransferase [Alteriqipengyuania halimionae]
MYKRFLTAFAPLALTACATLPSAAPTTSTEIGTVASADPRAAEAGMEMLRQGGNATDAAIATMLALTVVEPQSSGIGGGGFMLRGGPDGSVESFDGRETAPAAADGEWFFDANGQPQTYRDVVLTGLSVGVPGNVALAKLAHDKYGALPWATLFAPAIRLAADGFLMNARLHGSLEGNIARAGSDPLMRAIFYTEAGDPRPVGTRIVRPELAASLRDLAARGPEAMYGPQEAAALAAKIASATPGDAKMSEADVTGYEAKLRAPVCGMYRGYRICGMGPPSSGGIAVLAMIGQLERFDIAALGPRNPEFWHLFLESQKLAYADRELYTGDSDFVDVPVAGLIAPDYLARRSALIDPSKAQTFEPGIPAGAPQALTDGDEPVEHGTTHFVAIDRDGTMISYTSTVEGGFGSGLQFGGYYLNNELTDFSMVPEKDGKRVANRVEGGKRPRSSMAPTLVWDPEGRPFLMIGAAGGSTIPVQVARSIIGVIDFGMGIEEALALPLAMDFGSAVVVEQGSWLEDAITALEALGHENVRPASPPFRAVGAIRTQEGWIGRYDPRLDGVLDPSQKGA